jgi:hypothetical protein
MEPLQDRMPPPGHRLELAAVNGDDRFGEQIEPLAQHDELAAHFADPSPLSLRKLAMVLKSGISRRSKYRTLDPSHTQKHTIAAIADAAAFATVAARGR